MKPDPEPGRLFLHLKAAQTAMRAALTDAIADIGITSSQLLILRAIDSSPALSCAELARHCFVSPQAMIVNVARLEAAGLVERTKGIGRTQEVRLSDKGRAAADRAGERIQTAERYVTQQLGEDTVEALDHDLQRLTDCLLKSVVVSTSRSWESDEI